MCTVKVGILFCKKPMVVKKKKDLEPKGIVKSKLYL